MLPRNQPVCIACGLQKSKNAWVDTNIFRDWFHKNFVAYVKEKLTELRQDCKAILILYNCAAHSREEELVSMDGKVVAKFLPLNVTSLIQPMDQGVLEYIKRIYRKSILTEIVAQPKSNVIELLKNPFINSG